MDRLRSGHVMRKNQLYNVVRVYCLRNKGKHPVPKGYVVTDNIHNTCVCVPVCVRVRVHQRCIYVWIFIFKYSDMCEWDQTFKRFAVIIQFLSLEDHNNGHDC